MNIEDAENTKESENIGEQTYEEWDLMKRMMVSLWQETTELRQEIDWEMCEKVDEACWYHGVYFPCDDDL